VAVLSGLGSVSVLRGNGDGTFQAPADFLTDFHGTNANAVIVGDFNGDGKPDLAATNLGSDDVSVLLNTSVANHNAPVSTSTALAEDLSSSVFGQPVTLTATVTSSSGTPTGTVNFMDGSTLLAQVAVDPTGHASFTVSSLGVGPHSLTASFAGTAPFLNSASAALAETVAKDATTTALGVQHFGGDDFELTATVAPAPPGGGVPTGTVTFFDGTTVLGTAQLSGGSGTLLAHLGSGTHSLTASYGGDLDFDSSMSGVVTITN
jgi:hypothetical protein